MTLDGVENTRPVQVCMAEFSDVRYDSRVLRAAQALSDSGLRVDVHMYNSGIRSNRVRHEGKVAYIESAFAQKARNRTAFERFRRLVRAASILVSTNLRIALSRYDVYHMHNLKYALGSCLAASRWSAPLVYDAHELHYAHYDPGSAKGRVLNRVGEAAERFVTRHASAVIQASQERADAFVEHYGVAPPVVVRNSTEYIDCSTRDTSLRTALGVSPDERLMFYSGGIYAGGGRRLDAAIEALAHLPTVHLAIVGFMNDSIAEALRATARRVGVVERVHIADAVPPGNLVRYASGADVGVIPLIGNDLNTRLSALNKVSEYLMAGLPLVCSDYPVLKTIVDNDGNGPIGEVFDASSPISVATAVTKILDEGRQEDYRARALKRAAVDMRWDVDARKLLALYSGLTTSRSSTGPAGK